MEENWDKPLRACRRLPIWAGFIKILMSAIELTSVVETFWGAGRIPFQMNRVFHSRLSTTGRCVTLKSSGKIVIHSMLISNIDFPWATDTESSGVEAIESRATL